MTSQTRSRGNFVNEEYTLQTDQSNKVTRGIRIAGVRDIFFNVTAVDGDHNNHVVGLQCSPDNTNWYNTAATVLGLGMTQISINSAFVRLKVITIEGARSNIKGCIQGK